MRYEELNPKGRWLLEFEERKIIAGYYYDRLQSDNPTPDPTIEWCDDSLRDHALAKMQHLVLQCALGEELPREIGVGWSWTITTITDYLGLDAKDVVDIINTAIHNPESLKTREPTVSERAKLIHFLSENHKNISVIILETLKYPIAKVAKDGGYDIDYIIGTLSYAYVEPECLGLSVDDHSAIINALIDRIDEEEFTR